VGTRTPDVTIRQKPITVATVKLLYSTLRNKTMGIQFLENVLYNFGLNRRCGPAEFIKVDIEPTVNIRMDGIITIA
jgi:hypothetical protein